MALKDLFAPKDNNTTQGDPFLDAVIAYETTGTDWAGLNALHNSDVYTAIRTIAADVATNPIKYTDTATQAGKKLNTLLTTTPNNQQTAYKFWFSIVANMLLFGNAYARVIRNDSGQIAAIQQMENGNTSLQQDSDTGALTYTYNDGTHKISLQPAEVLHFLIFSTDGITGRSPLMSLTTELQVADTSKQLQRDSFKAGIWGTGILKVHKSDLNADAANAIRNKWEASNAGKARTLILDDTMDYSRLEVNTDVLQLAGNTSWTKKQIAAAFGLPIEKLGGESEHSNTSMTNAQYLQSTLIYYFKAITSELDTKLATQGNSFSIDTTALFTADPATQYALYENAVTAGIMTAEEAREKLGLPPVANGTLRQPSAATTTDYKHYSF